MHQLVYTTNGRLPKSSASPYPGVGVEGRTVFRPMTLADPGSWKALKAGTSSPVDEPLETPHDYFEHGECSVLKKESKLPTSRNAVHLRAGRELRNALDLVAIY